MEIVTASLCSGHRYKEHTQVKKTKRIISSQSSAFNNDRNHYDVEFQCSNKKCNCKHFFFVVAEGAWILRCRCKHKHVEHSCSDHPFICEKSNCSCSGFDR